MPKQKTHNGARKRFKVTGTGKLLRRRDIRTSPPGKHIKRNAAKPRRVREDQPVAPSFYKAVTKMLGGKK